MDPENRISNMVLLIPDKKKAQSSQNIVHINILITIISHNCVFKQQHLNYLPLIFLCGNPSTFHTNLRILQVTIWEPILLNYMPANTVFFQSHLFHYTSLKHTHHWIITAMHITDTHISIYIHTYIHIMASYIKPNFIL
jgi:hypothetical protein